MNQEVYKAILGQGGALALAVVILYSMMGSYEKLIDNMLLESKEDRALYQTSMQGMTDHMHELNVTLQQIQSDIAEIKNLQSSKK
jgi:hypothetical protein